jgi:dihydrofolate reductase
MRKLIYGINVAIDGSCDHTKFNPDDEVHDYFARLMRESGALVYGRKTYELMVPFWPDIAKNPSQETKGLDDFAQAFDSVPQIIVFSRSLNNVDDKKTKIVRTGLQDEVLNLKQQPGKNILTGGVAIPSQLIEHGLVDEIRLVVHPTIVGKGRRLFDEMNLAENLEFKLTDSQIFKSGCIALRYLRP